MYAGFTITKKKKRNLQSNLLAAVDGFHRTHRERDAQRGLLTAVTKRVDQVRGVERGKLGAALRECFAQARWS